MIFNQSNRYPLYLLKEKTNLLVRIKVVLHQLTDQILVKSKETYLMANRHPESQIKKKEKFNKPLARKRQYLDKSM